MPKPVCHGITSNIWYSLTRGNPSFRRLVGKRTDQPIVVAVGGNSFEGLEEATARNIVNLARHSLVVITHGNGPQVGKKLEEAEDLGIKKSISECTKETQLDIGLALSEYIRIETEKMNLSAFDYAPEIIETHVVVDPNDPAFQNPTKYIGREFPLEKFKSNSSERGNGLYNWEEGRQTWIMKEVPGKSGIFRRVVPSPKPLRIYPFDLNDIRKSVRRGKNVIAVGGGGIPVFPDGTRAEAVIDKDLATALLCQYLEAQSLIISTGVNYVAHNFKKSDQKDILYYQLQHALRNLKKGEYPEGAMGEKIEAAINVLRFGVNEVLISDPESSWVDNEGTFITRGIDFTGRLYNLARSLDIKPEGLQRWLVT